MSLRTAALTLALLACTGMTVADEPAPGKQVAQSIELPKNLNVFGVRGDGDSKRRIMATEAPLDENEKEQVGYWIYLPKNYEAGGEAVPLMLFLHGAGERGDNIDVVKKHGPPKLCETAEDWPFLTISPQCPKDRWWHAQQMLALLDEIVEKYNVDEDRVYITGLSMGGFGTWSITAADAKRFAAAAPICGGGQVENGEKVVDLPMWVFHGEADSVVPVERSKEMVEAIKTAGGEKVQITTYPGVGHDSWTQTYENSELYKWMLSHKREK